MWELLREGYYYLGLHSHFYIVLMGICVATVFYMFYKKNKQFNATDLAPQLNYFGSEKTKMINLATSEIEVGLFIKGFTVFDVIHNNFIIDIILWFEFNPALISLEAVDKFSFERGIILQKSEPKMKLKNNTLFVKYNLVLQVSTNLDQHLFPINDHNLYIVLTNEYVSPTEVVFKVYKSNFSWSDKLYTTDWAISGKSSESGYAISKLDQTDSSKNISNPRVVFTLNLARAGMRLALLIFLPIFLLGFLGQISLILNSTSMSSLVISLSVTSVTGLLAYRFVIDTISPNVGYFMLTDYFYTLILGTSFVSFILGVMQSFLVGDLYLIKIIKESYFVFLQVFMIGATYYLLYYWNEFQDKKVAKGGIEKYNSVVNALLKEEVTLKNLNRCLYFMEEYPLIDNDNWLNPNYDSYHTKTGLTFWHRLRRNLQFKFGNTDLSKWFLELFVVLISRLTNMENIIYHKNAFFLKMRPSRGSRFVIWGDLQGAFHSLLRDLNELKAQGIVNDNLKIIKDDIYFVFNGNAIDRSPHVLETLTLIMILIERNKDKVFYLRGHNENKNLWHDYQLHKELETKLRFISNDMPFFEKMIEDFFDRLPFALYLQALEETPKIIRIAPSISLETSFDESRFNDFLAKKEEEILTSCIPSNAKKIHHSIQLEAIIQSAEMSSFRKRKSVDFLLPEKGIRVWNIFSAPTRAFQIMGQFYNDTFAMLDINANINDWVLSIFFQDVRTKAGFLSKSYNLVYGFEQGEKGLKIKVSEKKEILLGSTLDLSRTSMVLGKRLYEGIMLGITHQNTLGGIANSFLKLVVFDDQYTPYIARNNVLKLYNTHKTDLILSPLGTPTTESFLPMIREKKILVLFPYTGANIFRTPELTHVVHFRTSYANEAKALVDYAVNVLGVKRFGVFYQEDSYGKSALEGTIASLKKHNIEEWLEAPYQRNRPQVDEAAKKMINFNPNAILFFSTNAPSISLIKTLGIHNLTDKYLLGISFLTDIFREYLKTVGLTLIISRVIPNVHANLEIVKEYRTLMKEASTPYLSEDSLEGYINVKILMDILSKIEGVITKEKILAAIEKIEDYDFKGLHLNFDPNTRELFKSVWIDNGRGDWIPWKEVQ